jgi:hypothetical protein
MAVAVGNGRATRAGSLVELESLDNGPIPDHARAVARLGTPAMVMLVRARAETAFFRGMVRGQLRAIRRRRADGSAYPALYEDLALYLRHSRAWHALAIALRSAVDAPRPRAEGQTRSPATWRAGLRFDGITIARSRIGPHSALFG